MWAQQLSCDQLLLVLQYSKQELAAGSWMLPRRCPLPPGLHLKPADPLLTRCSCVPVHC